MDSVSYQEKIDELIPLAEQEATERLRYWA